MLDFHGGFSSSINEARPEERAGDLVLMTTIAQIEAIL